LSQRALARELRYGSHSTIAQLEAGRRIPSADIIEAYQRHFAVPDDSLRRLRGRLLVELSLAAHDQALRLGQASTGATVDTSRSGAVGDGEPVDGGDPVPETDAGSDPPSPALPDRPRRRWRLLAVMSSVAAVLLVVAVVAWYMRRTEAIHDGWDPYVHGCRGDETELERRPVLWPDGQPYGQVVMFYSHACQGVWGYVYGPNSPSWRVYIVAYRAEGSGHDESSFRGVARPNSWGNAMSTRHGCVAVQAWVRTREAPDPVDGPIATTSCWNPI
jgi:transcriptional regulator with XRE-family HTH domain